MGFTGTLATLGPCCMRLYEWRSEVVTQILPISPLVLAVVVQLRGILRYFILSYELGSI